MSAAGDLVVYVSNESGRRARAGTDLPPTPDRAPSVAAVRHIARAALRSVGIEQAELSVLLVDDAAITELNARWRDKNKPTNVLSFPLQEPAGEDTPAAGPLGDVVVSLDTVARQGTETGSGYGYTFAFYLVHGILHLLAWDHETPKDSRRMRRKTRDILSAAGVT